MHRLVAALVALLLLCGQSPIAGFPPGAFQDRAPLDAGAAAATLSLDGSAEANSSNATTSVSITTTKPDNVILVFALTNGSDGGTSMDSPTLGSFTKRATSTTGGGPIQLWYAISSGVLTSESITFHTGGGGSFTTLIAFAVNGAKTSAPFDVNGSLPATLSGTPSDPLSVSTTAANTMIIGGFRLGTSNPTAGTGYTAIQLNGDYTLAEYKIVSATQSGLSVTIGTGVNDSNGGIADAIVQGP